MRIALLSHQWPGARMGGIGTCVRQTALALAGAGHDVHVFTLTLPEDVRRQIPPEIRVHEAAALSEAMQGRTVPAPLAAAAAAGGAGAYRLALAWRLAEPLLALHRDQPFDVVEAPEVEALGLPLLLCGFDAPVVTHLHCPTAVARSANELANHAIDAPLVDALESAAIHLADAVCAPTKAVLELTRELAPVPSDGRVIPHPFVAGEHPFEPPPANGPIVFVGRLERLKGVEVLADALNLFLPRRPTVTFRFIGPDTTNSQGGSMRQWIESRLEAFVRSRVAFTGELSPSDVSAAWREASFAVLPSLRENFSMALCEAMAAGRTAVVAAGTGSVEVLGDTGVVAEHGSAGALARAMETLWNDRRRLRELSGAAYERVRAFCSPDRVAAARVAFYRETIQAFSRQGAEQRTRKLATLPPACAAAVLPALGRMTAMLAGVRPPGTLTPGTRLLGIMDELERRQGTPAAVLLYGAGKHTARLLSERHVWESRRHRVVGIIDDHPRFGASPQYLDLPVQSVRSAHARLRCGGALPPVVLSTDTYEDQFWAQCAPLREAGVPVFRLYSTREQACST
ncbi:MAG TPA: glycosyltransferase family 4 protein [Tepidisphaeraceae bacterium]|jgi:glycogen(starch) synthase